MDQFSIADLEAELGCFDRDFVDIGPRKDHGGSDKVFEVPAEAASRLEPPSKTKSIYPFGADGTLAWATPAGELLQFASCIKGKLAGVDYRNSVEKGKDYQSRTKMLQTALNLPQGSGNGIGLSLDLNIHPINVHWIHNRWPRFIYQFRGMEIRLQYYVTSQSVVQQYLIRNDGDEDISLPYIISTDILFRDHEFKKETFRPVPISKSSERLMLAQNSELLVSNEPNDVQFEIAVFLNKHRISLWMKDQPSDDGDKTTDSRNSEVVDQGLLSIEETLRDRIVNRNSMRSPSRLVSNLGFSSRLQNRYFFEAFERISGDRRLQKHKRRNFAKFHTSLVVPRGSSQELCAILKISGPLHLETTLDQTASKSVGVQSKDHAVNRQGPSVGEERMSSKIRHEETALFARMESSSFDISDASHMAQVTQFMQKSLLLGQAQARFEEFEFARYHFFIASLIAEIVHKEDIELLGAVHFRYAKFLLRHGWYPDGLKKMEDLVQKMSNEEDRNVKTPKLWSEVRIQLASIYLDLGRFSEAENFYQQSLQYLKQNPSALEPVSASVWERIAWAKVNQGHYEQASAIYTRLLDQGFASRQTLLSNLGFLKRRLGKFADAQEFYVHAIEEFTGDKTNKIFARSGLSSCLRSLRATPESIDRLSASSIQYIDINDTLSQVQYLQSASKDDHPFGFVLSRYLETLLSLCSIQVKGKDVSGIMFVGADPVECAYEGRNAFFQFKSLIQYYRYLSKIDHHESVDAKRIQVTCEAHLVWVFKIAPTLNTWYTQYSVGGASENSSVEHPSDENPLSNVVEGAFHFLKLCLYHEVWKEKWELVLDLLYTALEDWLSYLVSTQHMGNLWVENESIEILKPQHDSLSRDRDTINQAYPQYYLADFSVLWLALMQLEILITSLEHIIKSQNKNREDTARLNIQKVRETFNSHRPTLSPENIQAKIINTFKVFKGDSPGGYDVIDTATNSFRAARRESIAFTGPFGNSPMSRDPTNRVEISLQDGAISRRDQQLIVFRRTIKEYSFEVQPTDITTLEAYTFGMFEYPQDQDAWHATINMQEEKTTATSCDTRLIALALLGHSIGHHFVRINEDKVEDTRSKEALLRERLSAASYDSGCFALTTAFDQPERTQSWSGVSYEQLSVLMASLYEECRTLLPSKHRQEGQDPVNDSQRRISTSNTRSRMQNRKTTRRTGVVSTFSRVNQKNVYDTGFLPDWMYHYPAFFHEQTLIISPKQDLKQLSSIEGLKSAVDRYKASQDFKGGESFRSSYAPAMFDSGVQRRTNPEDAFPERQLSIRRYYFSASFWAQLLKPRTPDRAKKRLIEISSRDKDSALMCWLSSPQQEKPFLWLFLSRNDALENFFGERADKRANLWETEFHLGFYQLLDSTDSPSRAHSREMPSLSQNQGSRTIAPVALSFRFVGDLRDRFWSCLFLSSETIDFKGLVQQYYDSSETREQFYEKQGQRKTLELFYVERMLNEMVTSIDKIHAAFKTELAVSPKSQSFEFIYHYSGLQFHLEASEILQDVLQKVGLSVKVIEEWEKREDTRGLPSRWSLKDEDRYGEMLKHLTQNCKINLQKLRIQHNQLGEQRKYADQWYTNLVSYKQLQEAHTSTQSAEDVRLFTYVTIIFLPLSFSSSLFSMAGTPQATTLAVMGPTTVIALALTILLLANMNLLNRKLSFWFDKAKINAREKMAASKNSSVPDWSRVAKELNEAAQLQATGIDTKERLPAESKWWYFFFWLCYCFRLPRIHVRSCLRAWKNWNELPLHLIVRTVLALLSLPLCILVFTAEELLLMTNDTLILILAMLRRTLNRPGKEKAIGRRDRDGTSVKDKDTTSEETTSSESSSDQPAWVPFSEKLYGWLESPPRPVKDYRKKRYGPAADQKAKLSQNSSDSESDSDSSSLSSIHANELPRDEIDDWISSPADGIDVKPPPDSSANPARGTTTDETRTQIEDLV